MVDGERRILWLHSTKRVQLENDFMLKLLSIGLLLLSAVRLMAQIAPALDAFIDPDGAFQFSYPDSYELLVGERILKATQGRNLVFFDFGFCVAGLVLLPAASGCCGCRVELSEDAVAVGINRSSGDQLGS